MEDNPGKISVEKLESCSKIALLFSEMGEELNFWKTLGVERALYVSCFLPSMPWLGLKVQWWLRFRTPLMGLVHGIQGS